MHSKLRTEAKYYNKRNHLKEIREYRYLKIIKRGLSYQHKYPIKTFNRDIENEGTYYLS